MQYLNQRLARYPRLYAALRQVKSLFNIDNTICVAGRLIGIAIRERPLPYKNGELHRQIRRHIDLINFIQSSHIPVDSSILDVGCGLGWLAEQLYEAGFSRIDGIDWLHEAKLSPTARLKFSYTRANLNIDGLSPYANQSVDVIVCSDVLEHLENPAQMLREFHRVLVPNGHIFLALPNTSNIFERWHILRKGNSSRYKRHKPSDYGHISMLPTWVLQSLCDRAGIEIVEEGKGYLWWKNHFWFLNRQHSHLFSYVAYYHLMRKADFK